MSSSREAKTWKAAIYVRVSKVVGKSELENQRDLVIRHLETLTNVQICSVKVDNGYSGLHDNRPAFQEILKEIGQGDINCVAVYDLSRLSRNGLNAGMYIHDKFPAFDVRVISVFDRVDLMGAPDYNNFLAIGARTLINEDYLHRISLNIKNTLHMRYAQGKHMGAFTVYGYRKSHCNRYQLEVDHIPAKIVRDIFQRKLEGLSSTAIAEQLELSGALSPAEYKKSILSGYTTNFQKNAKAKWTHISVVRILSNRIYTGCLEQGQSHKSHFKSLMRTQKPQSEWVCVKNTHEAIIPAMQFEAVSRLLLMDTRTAPGEKVLSPLAGFVRCRNCGQNMILKSSHHKNKQYLYYVCCGKNEENKPCFAHRISKCRLEEEVLIQLHRHIGKVEKLYEMIPFFDILHIEKLKKKEKAEELFTLTEQLELNNKRLDMLNHENIMRLHTKTDLPIMRQHYIDKTRNLKDKIKNTENDLSALLDEELLFGWIKQYEPHFSFNKITRPLLAYLANRITVDGNKTVEIEFLYEQDFSFIQSVFDDS